MRRARPIFNPYAKAGTTSDSSDGIRYPDLGACSGRHGDLRAELLTALWRHSRRFVDASHELGRLDRFARRLNALALSRAAPALQGRLKHDRTTFWLFVLLAAVASSLASVFGRSTTGYTETKGASGIVFAMLAHAAATDPAAPVFVYGMELPAATALVAMLAIDVLVRSARGIDYACHAGGALFGLAFYEYCKL